MNFAFSIFAARAFDGENSIDARVPGEREGMTTFERSQLENSTNVGKTLKKLLDPPIVDDFVIAASRDPFNHKTRDPWTTSCKFNNQVHRR